MSRTLGSLIGHNVSSRVKATEVPTTATGVTIGQEIEPCKSVAIDWFSMVYYRRLYDISSSSDNSQRYTGSTSICRILLRDGPLKTLSSHDLSNP